MKEEALKLADELDDCSKYGECDWVYPKIPADMIRKLVAELDRVEDIRNYYAEEQGNFSKPYTAPRELSDEEIADIYKEIFKWDVKASDRNWVGLARAILKKASEK
jgi:hypothetical protein